MTLKKITIFSLSILLILSNIMLVSGLETNVGTNEVVEQSEEYTLESEQFKEFLIEKIRNNQTMVDVSDFNIRVDVSNGCHILSDFQDDFLYEYSEDSFCVENLTFTHQNGKLLTIKINYAADLDELEEMRADVSARIDAIVAEVSDIEDETEKIGKVSELIWSNYYDDFSFADIWINDSYGCLVRGYASRFGAACGFQAVMHRLGYKGGYYLAGADIYSKNFINGEWKYTNIAWNQSRKNNTYLLTDVTESTRNYGKQALTSEEYTPISMFSDNPYLNQRNENSQYLAEQFLAGSTEITLPNPVYYNYKKGYSNYITNVKHEYPDAGFLVGSCGTSVKNDLLTIKPTYIEDEETREEMLKAFHNEVDKIVERANKLNTDEEKIIFINNYITKTTTYKEYENGVKLPYSHDAYGCLVNGECVCEGYATAFHMIMKELGINDTYVQSYNHIWNKVLLNGEYKIIDVTNNGDNHYLLGYNHEANTPNGSLKLSRYTYVFNNTLSMNSSSTKYVVKELSKGTEHIDTSNINFWLDSRSKHDIKWYIDTLKNIYPIEMRDVDTMEFITEGDNILGIDVTYKERSEEDIAAFEEVVDGIVASASEKATEEEKVAAVMNGMYRSGIKGAISGEEDVVACTLSKSGTYLAKTRLCCYILEKLGIRYTVIKDRNVYYYVKNVYDGTVRYSSPVLSGYINLEEIKSYNIFNDYRVFDFINPDVENAYIDGIDFDMVLDEMFVPNNGSIIEPEEPEIPEEPDVKISINDITIEGLCDKIYTGNEITQELSLSYDGKALVENQDYSIAYDNNVNVGIATITITGLGDYEGTIEKTFNINSCSITGALIENLNASYSYTGQPITPNINVTLLNKTLVKNTDYKVTFENNTNAGTARVIVTGIGNYSDSIRKTFTIIEESISISSAKISGLNTSYTYTGSAITPTFTVSVNNVNLNKDTDYSVTYKNNVNIGTATIEITGKGKYKGTLSSSFKIVPISITNATISGLNTNYTYTGSAITPALSIKVNNKVLQKDVDYRIAYSNNINAGTATCAITGIGNYTDSLSRTFVIDKINLSSASISGINSNYAYIKSAIMPNVVVKVGSKTLVKNVDYKVMYSNNVNVGRASIKIEGIGNYKGTVTKEFNITAKSIIGSSITGIASSYTYSGNYIMPNVTVKLNGKTLVKNTDYRVTYVSNLNAGTASVIINGLNNYMGSITKTFKINKASMNKVTISGVKAKYKYTKKAIKPNPVVKYNGKILKKNIDYTVSYNKNKKIGTAKITIKGKGNFTGTRVKTFKIKKKI